MKVNKIVILVELEDGNIHQVLTTPEQKQIALNMCINDKGGIDLSSRVEPIKLEVKP